MKISVVKLAIGVTLFGLVAAAWGPFALNHTTTLAVVNAETIRLSAPFQGIAAPDLPPPGTRLRVGAELPLLEAAVPEERELDRLSMELATSRARLARLEDALVTLDRHEMDVRERWRSLVETGREVLARTRDEAEARRRALERGVHLTDGYNDVPYNVQQLDRLLLLREQILDRLAEERAREGALARAVATERRAAELRARYTQRLDRNLVVWARHAAPGAIVGPGAPLLDLIDCDRLFVDALLPDRVYPNILGARPRIRLAGGLSLEGEIAQIRGSGARGVGVTAAAQPTADAVERLSLRISFPPGHSFALEGEGGNLCGVGRQAEVVIPGTFAKTMEDIVATISQLHRRISDFASRMFAIAAAAS